MVYIIIPVVFFIIFFVGIPILGNIMLGVKFVNLLDSKKVSKLNYTSLEIKRNRRPMYISSTGGRLAPEPYHEAALESVYRVPGRGGVEDIIEVYGIESNNKKRLIYKKAWSMEDAKTLKGIVVGYNASRQIMHLC
jgi:hypothetical protein